MAKKLNSVFNPRNRGKEELEVEVSIAGEEYAKVFGANKNIMRITPYLIDGLKPVQRRIIYTMYNFPNHGKTNKKVNDIVGRTMGAFHPHGDGSIETACGNMAQRWNWVLPLLADGGSYGSVRGDDVAAARYLETHLTDFASDCYFSNFEKTNVPMRLSYNESDKEPEYLPAKYPVFLINPQLSGIGFGVASNIPPFNFNEVCKATIKLIHDEKAKVYLIPDSQTGCDIVDIGLFPEMNKTGKSKFTLRATYDIDYIENIITITSLPINITSEGVRLKLISLWKEGKFDTLVDIADETQDDKVCLKIYLTKDDDPDKRIQYLFKKQTDLCKTYSCELRFTHDYNTYVYSPRKALLTWLEYRRDCVRSTYNEYIMSTMKELHMLNAMILVTSGDNANETIEIVKSSKNNTEATERLIKRYKISSLHASTIAGMRISDFVGEKRDSYVNRKPELEKALEKYTAILEDEDGIDNVIEAELNEGIKKWGRPRLSKVVKADKTEGKIPNTNHVIGISSDGYIKKLNYGEYSSIGKVGKVGTVMAIAIGNRDNLLVFDSDGLISRIAVSAIPTMKYDDKGVEISRYFKVNSTIVSCIRESDVKEHKDSNIVLVTEKGYGKKTSLGEFNKIKDYTIAISLADGDKLISAIPAFDSEDFIVYTNHGDGIRLSTKDFKSYKKTAKGLNLLSLRTNEKVTGIDILNSDMKYLLYITSLGRLKLTDMKLFPTMKRKDEPLSLIALEPNEELLGVRGVLQKDLLTCYRKKNKPVDIMVKDIPVTSRIAKAEKMVKLPNKDVVITYTITHN